VLGKVFKQGYRVQQFDLSLGHYFFLFLG
jgi:hypothetical protein